VDILVTNKYESLASMMNERLQRRWAACEAMALGYGGISAVSQATGLSRGTIRKGMTEIKGMMPDLASEIEGRVRRPGGGRQTLADRDQTLIQDLEDLVADSTRGDPMSPLRWTSKSTRKLAEELRNLGHVVSHMSVNRILNDFGYSLRSNRKKEEGKQSPDRDAQFRFIGRKVRLFQSQGQPVISVDSKKREILGNIKNPGTEWRPKGNPRPVKTHDFRDKHLGHAIPYGVFDMTQNEGWVSVGIDHNTAEFAANSILCWWREMGSAIYPNATSLLVTADAGGSNGIRNRLWKVCLQDICNKTGLKISICHFPPGTSKWNKIDHRMFCHISKNWQGRPLESVAVVVNLIANTTTNKGLHIKSALDSHSYPVGIKIRKKQLESLNLIPDDFHGDWNYTLAPV